ncbi:MAG: capsid assembly protein [Alphaproteobacteria bacterium]
MADTLLTEAPAAAPAADAVPPLAIPEKFRDPKTGALRVEALLKSYLELERRLSQSQQQPDESAVTPPDPASFDPASLDPVQLRRLLGAPESAEGYCIACDHGLFQPDPEINGRLFEAGYTPVQAQLLYDLAAERMVPLIQTVAAEFQAEREVERLVARFGGEERWREVSRQLLAWAGKTLPPAAVEGLATSYEGVMALYSMMTGSEPSALSMAGTRPGGGDGEAELRTLMRDPRYWRDRDPAVIARVTDGYQRLYPSQG